MESMTEKSIDDFLHGRLASNEQWERFLNHRQLHDCFVGIEDDVILNAYSKEIEVSWRNTLSAINPRYQVYAYYDDANGPSLTFFFKK